MAGQDGAHRPGAEVSKRLEDLAPRGLIKKQKDVDTFEEFLPGNHMEHSPIIWTGDHPFGKEPQFVDVTTRGELLVSSDRAPPTHSAAHSGIPMLNDEIVSRLRQSGYEGDLTLGTLIAACGDKFISLRHEANSRYKWIACTDSPLFDGYFTIVGATPEDAVGELLFRILGTQKRHETDQGENQPSS